jgi:hypothetical protein
MNENSIRTRLYSEAACTEVDMPGFFDGTNPNDIYTKAALEICKICTVQVQCLIVVKPRESFFDGVCAGKVWQNGKIIGDEDGALEEETEFVDLVAVDRLIKCELPWSKVKMIDRKYAVIKMRKQGLGISVIMKIVNMNGTQIKKLLSKEGLI